MGSSLFEKIDVLGSAVIRITRSDTAASISDFTRLCGKLFPDRGTATVFLNRSFDLVAGESSIELIGMFELQEVIYLAVAKPQRKSDGRDAFDIVALNYFAAICMYPYTQRYLQYISISKFLTC